MARPGFDTHAVPFDRLNQGRKSLAECGEYVDERDITIGVPTCEECRRDLARTAGEVFGERTEGTQVKSTYGDPVKGYSPRTR